MLSSIFMAIEEKALRTVLRWIPESPERRLAPDERPVKIANADALVLGMGRVDMGVYHRLHDEYGLNVYGIDFNEERIVRLRATGHQIIAGDVTDSELWQRIELEQSPRLYVLALPGHRDAYDLVTNIRRHNTKAVVAGTSRRFVGISGYRGEFSLHQGTHADGANRRIGNISSLRPSV